MRAVQHHLRSRPSLWLQLSCILRRAFVSCLWLKFALLCSLARPPVRAGVPVGSRSCAVDRVRPCGEALRCGAGLEVRGMVLARRTAFYAELLCSRDRLRQRKNCARSAVNRPSHHHFALCESILTACSGRSQMMRSAPKLEWSAGDVPARAMRLRGGGGCSSAGDPPAATPSAPASTGGSEHKVDRGQGAGPVVDLSGDGGILFEQLEVGSGYPCPDSGVHVFIHYRSGPILLHRPSNLSAPLLPQCLPCQPATGGILPPTHSPLTRTPAVLPATFAMP